MEQNKLKRWVADGCPPIDLNQKPGLIIDLVRENKLLTEALIYVRDVISNSEEWWMSCRFDLEIIDNAINQTK